MNEAQDRYARLRSYLELDGNNENLLRDAAQAALAANAADEALALLDRLAGLRPLDNAENNDRAIAAMRSGQPELAAEAFARLREQAPEEPALALNLAWALSLAGRHEEAEAALTKVAVATLPQAAMLQVELAHQAGRLDKAQALARHHLTVFPTYGPLLASVSVLAMDIDDPQLARQCAEGAPDHPDAMTTLGLLSLGDNDVADARNLLERALVARPASPRALIGLGLASLAEGDPASAGGLIDRGAEIFGDHLGSWIASGWSYLLAGQTERARARFEHAQALDDTFAETHGSLAVMAIVDGRLDDARRACEVALRLDRRSFTAAFAQILLAAGDGDSERAQGIMDMALRQPLGEDGRTLADAMAKMAL